ncbi:MAG: hypothetical protein CFE21_16955 [Bacteroidetes bacterium B1(2017)]|nr:MAG: hypothetical protein CFE21_16955 [Bacteroidetes bacterium B1(2017)]
MCLIRKTKLLMKKLLLNLACALLALNVGAQAPTPAPAPPAAAAPSTTIEPLATGNKGTAIGLIISTDGVGLQFAQNLNAKKNLAIRVGGMYIPYTLSNFAYNFDGTDLLINGDIKLGAFQAIFDYHPFSNAFKLSGGAAYMLSAISATAMVKDSVKQGDISISPDEVGKIDVGLKVGPICPYVGLGFGRAVPRSRFSFNFELGAYYINQPQVSFKASGMLEPTSSQQKVLQDNMSGYNWLPIMNFGFNFKIGK